MTIDYNAFHEISEDQANELVKVITPLYIESHKKTITERNFDETDEHIGLCLLYEALGGGPIPMD